MFKIRLLTKIIASMLLMPLSTNAWCQQITADDLPEDATTTRSIKVGSFETGAFEQVLDIDWMRVNLDALVTYKIKMTADKLAAVDLKLVSVDGLADTQILANDRDEQQPMEATIVYTPEFSGAYYVVAATDSNSTGYYILSVEEVSRPVNLPYPVYYPFGSTHFPGGKRSRRNSPRTLPARQLPSPSPRPQPSILITQQGDAQGYERREKQEEARQAEHRSNPPPVEMILSPSAPQQEPQAAERQQKQAAAGQALEQTRVVSSADQPVTDTAAPATTRTDVEPVAVSAQNTAQEEAIQEERRQKRYEAPPQQQEPMMDNGSDRLRADPVSSANEPPPVSAPEPSPQPPAPAPEPSPAPALEPSPPPPAPAPEPPPPPPAPAPEPSPPPPAPAPEPSPPPPAPAPEPSPPPPAPAPEPPPQNNQDEERRQREAQQQH